MADGGEKERREVYIEEKVEGGVYLVSFKSAKTKKISNGWL